MSAIINNIMDISISQIFEAVLGISIGVISWFVKKIMADIKQNEERSRDNDRELYAKIAQTREDMLKLEIDRLKSLIK